MKNKPLWWKVALLFGLSLCDWFLNFLLLIWLWYLISSMIKKVDNCAEYSGLVIFYRSNIINVKLFIIQGRIILHQSDFRCITNTYESVTQFSENLANFKLESIWFQKFHVRNFYPNNMFFDRFHRKLTIKVKNP